MGTQLPSQKRGRALPQFSAHICCGQTAGWIKMPLGTKVGLGSGHIVLHGDPAPSPPKERGAQQPQNVISAMIAAGIDLTLTLTLTLWFAGWQKRSDVIGQWCHVTKTGMLTSQRGTLSTRRRPKSWSPGRIVLRRCSSGVITGATCSGCLWACAVC